MLDVNQPIELTGLENGQSYTVYALGKNTAGIWQTEPAASQTWTVDTSFFQLIIKYLDSAILSSKPNSYEKTFSR